MLPISKRDLSLAPLAFVMGLAAAIAETLSVGLVILFLYTLVNPDGGSMAASSSMLSFVFAAARTFTDGSSTSLAGLILVLIVAKSALTSSYGLLSAWLRHDLSDRVRRALFSQCMAISYEQYQQYDQGTLVNVIATESFTVAEALNDVSRIAISFCAILVFALSIIAISLKVALVSLIGSACLLILLRSLAKPIERLGSESTEATRRFADRTVSALQGMRTIRAFGQEDGEAERFAGVSRRLTQAFFNLDKLYSLTAPLNEIGYLALLTVLIGASGFIGVPGTSMLAALALLYRLQPHLRELEVSLLKLSGSEAALRNVVSLLDRADKAYPPLGNRPFEGLKREIRFDDVSFVYGCNDRPSLDKVSLTIRKGETTAIAGASGAGKTTLVNLLLRLLQPSTGRIIVDGVPLDQVSRKAWLSRIVVAGQDVELIEGSIYENIAIARPDVNPQLVVQAAETAAIASFIASMPNGYETQVGERGMKLSGGQRQRIGLARALICDPDILILDEATSALDSRIETAVRERITQSMRGKTLIVITHRLNTVLSADHMVCLVDGRVAEEGSPNDLLANETSVLSSLLPH